MRPSRALLGAVLLAAVLDTSASPVSAQTVDSAAAQALFDEAKALMKQGKVNEACSKFEESERLENASGTLVNLARCYEQSGRVASAWSTYLAAAAAAKATGNKEREDKARQFAEALAPRISRLVVKVPPEARVAGLEVLRDGGAMGPAQWGVAIPANEGEHEIIARAPGRRGWKMLTRVAGEGTTQDVEIPVLAREAPHPGAATSPSTNVADSATASSGLGTQKILALVSGGVAVASFGVATVFGLKAMSKKNDADKTCDGNACDTDAGVNAGNDAHSAGNVATVGVIVGAAALAGGVALWFTAPKDAPAIQARVGLGSVQISGAF